MERRLAAILAADVVGYARLMGQDEAGTLERSTELRQEIIEPLIAEHGGRIVKLIGDGLLVEFTSVVSAVACAVAWQSAVAAHQANRDAETRLQFRIGVNLGDVIVHAGDIHGDGVNIAARLEGLAEPGGICLSDDAYRQARGKIDAQFEDLGERKLKNVAEAMRVYRVSADSAARSASFSASETPHLPERPSLIVLPFEHAAGDSPQDFIADGIFEEIITALSKFRWLFVIDRNTAFSFKGKVVPVAAIARDLGARYVLEGSVRRSGKRVRINVHLVDATTGQHLWAERYDRQIEDIFNLLDEVTATIVGMIEPELGGAEQQRAKRKAPQSLDAWARYQQGLWHYWRRNRGDAEEAERFFQSATKTDPTFSLPYAGLAETCYIKLYHGWTDEPEVTLRRGMAAANQAISLADKDAFGRFALGRMYLWKGHFDSAISEFEEALSLNSNLARAHYGLDIALLWSGHAEEALPCAHRAIQQSPNDPLMHGFESLMGAGNF